MAITPSVTIVYKQHIQQGVINIPTDTCFVALYNSSAVLGPTTPSYTATNEVTGTNYTAGGVALAGNNLVIDGTTVITTFSNPSFVNINVSDIRGMMIYDTNNANSAIAVFDFGTAITITNATFTILFPAANAVTGLIRFN